MQSGGPRFAIAVATRASRAAQQRLRRVGLLDIILWRSEYIGGRHGTYPCPNSGRPGRFPEQYCRTARRGTAVQGTRLGMAWRESKAKERSRPKPHALPGTGTGGLLSRSARLRRLVWSVRRRLCGIHGECNAARRRALWLRARGHIGTHRSMGGHGETIPRDFGAQSAIGGRRRGMVLRAATRARDSEGGGANGSRRTGIFETPQCGFGPVREQA